MSKSADTRPISRARPKQSELEQALLTEQKLQHILSWALSFILHVLVLFVIAAVFAYIPNGTGGDRDGPIDTAIIYEMTAAVDVSGDQFQEEESGGGAIGGGDESVAASAVANLPGADSSPIDNASLLVGLLPSANAPAGGEGNASGGLGLGNGGSQLGSGGGSPKVKTKIFGIEGEGRRFVYVFDRSDSMNGYSGRPFSAAKAELRKSLESLSEGHEFQVIFYNDAPVAFGGLESNGPRWMLGSEANKRNANAFVRDIPATGGTQHLRALRMALTLNPDVVFFLTDADKPALRERDIDDLQNRASRSNATIHSIQFGEGPNQSNGNWIQKLAEGTSGKYRYINVSQLGDEEGDR